MSLPKKGTIEADSLIEVYRRSDRTRREELARKFGYSEVGNFQDRMKRKYGEGVPKPEQVAVEAETKYIPYPEVKLKPFKEPKSTRDSEDIAIVLSDWHLDKITESYNIKIAQERADFLLDSTMSIINLHRPIRKAHLFITGDVVQGENAFQGSKVGETAVGVYEQIHDDAVPLFTKFIESLIQGVPSIDVYGVRGNHGRYAKEAPDKTNWDRFFYKALKDALVNQKNINIYPSEWFYQLINIRGFRFFMVHGDQVSASQGIPLFALRRKMQEWYAYCKGFNYAYAGHFHTGAYDQINSESDYTICPPLVTGDAWALEKIGRASEPKQICFGIHDKYGRTFTYHLHTDEKFLPRKYDEPEGVVKL